MVLGLHQAQAQTETFPPITSRSFNIDLFAETSAHLHGSAEGWVFTFHFGGHERRVSISLAVDLADRYKNGGLSVGFWN